MPGSASHPERRNPQMILDNPWQSREAGATKRQPRYGKRGTGSINAGGAVAMAGVRRKSVSRAPPRRLTTTKSTPEAGRSGRLVGSHSAVAGSRAPAGI